MLLTNSSIVSKIVLCINHHSNSNQIRRFIDARTSTENIGLLVSDLTEVCDLRLRSQIHVSNGIIRKLLIGYHSCSYQKVEAFWSVDVACLTLRDIVSIWYCTPLYTLQDVWDSWIEDLSGDYLDHPRSPANHSRCT